MPILAVCVAATAWGSSEQSAPAMLYKIIALLLTPTQYYQKKMAHIGGNARCGIATDNISNGL